MPCRTTQRQIAIPIDSTQAIASVTVDPGHVIPDEGRSNNVLEGPFAPPGGGK